MACHGQWAVDRALGATLIQSDHQAFCPLGAICTLKQALARITLCTAYSQTTTYSERPNPSKHKSFVRGQIGLAFAIELNQFQEKQ